MFHGDVNPMAWYILLMLQAMANGHVTWDQIRGTSPFHGQPLVWISKALMDTATNTLQVEDMIHLACKYLGYPRLLLAVYLDSRLLLYHFGNMSHCFFVIAPSHGIESNSLAPSRLCPPKPSTRSQDQLMNYLWMCVPPFRRQPMANPRKCLWFHQKWAV